MESWFFLFLGLVLAYFLEFTRPWVKSYIEKSSLSLRQRRLYIVAKRYRRVKKFTENPVYLYSTVFSFFAIAVMFLTLLLLAMGMSRVEPDHLVDYFLVITAFMAFYTLTLIVSELRDVADFDDYRKKVISKYTKLGGNPEDLGKEETEGG